MSGDILLALLTSLSIWKVYVKVRIVAALGSFKDVYTSIEACNMMKNLLDAGENQDVMCAPVCDGGEYTYQVLKHYFQCKEELAEEILNPYGNRVSVPYLVINEEAFVISSEILRLNSEEDAYRNPLHLTDYGLGQVVRDAIQKGYQKINLCLGGTSTIGYGMGFAQALGARFWDASDSEILQPVTGGDLSTLMRAQFPREQYRDIKINVINDGITRCKHLHTVNPLKIGKSFANQEQQILFEIEVGKRNVLALTGLSEDDAYSGNGGAVYYGIQSIFDAGYCLGGEYFCHLFGLPEKIAESDLVITGEGRFDNPHLLKLPIHIAGIAKQFEKPVVYVCGQTEEGLNADIVRGICREHPDLQKYGITVLITCQDDIRNDNVPQDYQSAVQHFREVTPIILKEKLREIDIL